MLICILKTVEVLQHAYCQCFAESTWAAEENEIVKILQFETIASAIEINLIRSL
jgi:hypothetical protein